MNHQSLLIQRVCLQSVVISFFRFAEFIKKENYSLHTQDQDNSSNETGCIKGRLSHRLWGWSHSGICCTWCSNCLGSCRRGGLNCGFSCRIGCWHQSGCGHYRTEVCRVPHLTITNCWVMWTIGLIFTFYPKAGSINSASIKTGNAAVSTFTGFWCRSGDQREGRHRRRGYVGGGR